MKNLLVTIILLTSLMLYGQNNDYIIESDGDTVYCQIEKAYPAKIVAIINGKKQNFSPSDLREYHFNGKLHIS